MKDSIKPIRIQGQLFWSHYMVNFNKKFSDENSKYECTIGMLSDAACKALQDLNIKIKNKPEMGNFIVGKSIYKFTAVDNDGNDVAVQDAGNGTKCIALVSSYKHRMSAQHGYGPSISKLIITEIVTYNPEKALSEELDEYLL